MRRRSLWVGGAAVAAASAGLGWRVFRESGSAGDAADSGLWRQRFARPGGGELVMATLRGRPLVLNFWATWCPPCVREMPDLDRFHRTYASRGWQVLGLAIDREQPVREFLERSPVGYPIALGALAGTELGRRLGNQDGGLPFTVVFASDGRIVQRKLGATRYDEMVRWTGAA